MVYEHGRSFRPAAIVVSLHVPSPTRRPQMYHVLGAYMNYKLHRLYVYDTNNHIQASTSETAALCCV